MLLGAELDAALGNAEDDAAAAVDGDGSAWADDAMLLALEDRIQADRDSLGDLMARSVELGATSGAQAVAAQRADAVRTRLLAREDSLARLVQAEADSLRCHVNVDSVGPWTAGVMEEACRVKRRAGVAVSSALAAKRTALRDALFRLAPDIQWTARSARRTARWAARAEDRLDRIDRLAEQIKVVERLEERVSSGRAAQLGANLTMAQARLDGYSAHAQAAMLEHAATRLAAEQRRRRLNGAGAAFGYRSGAGEWR